MCLGHYADFILASGEGSGALRIELPLIVQCVDQLQPTADDQPFYLIVRQKPQTQVYPRSSFLLLAKGLIIKILVIGQPLQPNAKLVQLVNKGHFYGLDIGTTGTDAYS